jgi:cytochrome c oxidase cbb3-type subunit 2
MPIDADLERTIRRGLLGTAMVGQPSLGAADMAAVIAHVKSLSPRWASEPPGEPVTTAPPAGLEAAAARGPELYRKSGCFQCHGDAGRGDGPSARDLTSGGRSVRPTDLTHRPFKGGDTAADVYRALATGLDGTPMPSYRDAFDADQLWAVAVHVTRLTTSGSPPRETDDEKLGREIVAGLDASGPAPEAPASPSPAPSARIGSP